MQTINLYPLDPNKNRTPIIIRSYFKFIGYSQLFYYIFTNYDVKKTKVVKDDSVYDFVIVENNIRVLGIIINDDPTIFNYKLSLNNQ